MPKRLARAGYLILGLALFAFVLHQTDLADAWQRMREVGWGFALVLAIHLVAFLFDVGAWQATLVNAPVNARWLYRLWKLQMVGSAVSSTTPLATFGGEPVKAYLLNSLYGVNYRDGIASLLLTKTTLLLSLVAFLSIGFAVMVGSPALDVPFKITAGLGLLALGVGIALFYLIQRRRLTASVVHRLVRGRWGRRLEGMVEHVQDFENHVVRFYTGRRLRFAIALLLALANEFVTVLELYVVMILLGHPVDFIDALIIEAVAQLIRSGAFFIPGRLGAQEGGFIIACAAITGSPSLGLAVALLRRSREVVWIGWGLALGWAALPNLRARARRQVDEATDPKS